MRIQLRLATRILQAWRSVLRPPDRPDRCHVPRIARNPLSRLVCFHREPSTYGLLLSRISNLAALESHELGDRYYVPRTDLSLVAASPEIGELGQNPVNLLFEGRQTGIRADLVEPLDFLVI